jgi:F-type H+-transporting ATPase subunit gamma
MVSKKTVWASIQYLRKFKDISKAVQLVAIAKLRKLNRVLDSREYALSMATELFEDSRRENAGSTSYTIVIVTSEKSCCGKLNSDVLYSAKEYIISLIDETHSVSIVSIGWKCKAASLARYRSEMTHSIEQHIAPSMHLAYVVMLSILESKYDVCTIVFSKYYKVFEQLSACYAYPSYNAFVESILLRSRISVLCAQLLYLSLRELQTLYAYHVCIILLDSLEETKFSELGCRAFSMEMAHRNASDLIVGLLLVYNKARQGAITNDLLEVVSGASNSNE